MALNEEKMRAIVRKLVAVAAGGEPITYGELRDTPGVGGHCLCLSYYLASIGRKCHDNLNLPLLPALVVNKKKRIPGIGFYKAFYPELLNADEETQSRIAEEDQKRVFACSDWLRLLESYR